MSAEPRKEHGQASGAAAALFAGSGEMHAVCRQFDWAGMSLGPVEHWPGSLRVAVRLCLDASLPMAVYAGPERVLIYNDSYVPVLDPARHPWALGRPACQVWAEIWDRLGPELDQVMDHGEPMSRESWGFVLQRHGEERFFTYSLTPILEDDGRVVGVFNVFTETTESVRAERDLRRMFELSHDLLAVAGTDDRYRRINPAFTRVLGWSEDELLAHTGSYFVHPDDRERTRQELDYLADGRPAFHFENRCRHKDGSYRWLSWTAVPVPEDGLVYAAARDITARKQAEDALRMSAERDRFRAALADALRPLASPIDIEARGRARAGRVSGSQPGALLRAQRRRRVRAHSRRLLRRCCQRGGPASSG